MNSNITKGNLVQSIVAAALVLAFVVSSVAAIRTTAHKLRYDPLVVPIAANLGGKIDGIAEYTLSSPMKSSNYITCSDTGGCDLFITESGAQIGQVLRILNRSSNTVLIRERAGVLEMGGNQSQGIWDNIEFEYTGDRWVETHRENN